MIPRSRPLRGWRGPALALALCAAAVSASPDAARAQGTAGPPPPAVGDVPPGPGTIRGRIVHATEPGAAAGVEVVLYALPAAGSPGVRRARTDAEGRFAFEGITNDPDTAYLVGARYQDISFPGQRVVFAPGRSEAEVEVTVTEATADGADVVAGAVRLRLDRVGDRLVVSESHALENPGSRVVFVPEAARDAARAPFRTGLPEGAGALTGPLGIVPEGLVRRGDEVAFFGPIYPGRQELGFQYSVSLPAGDGAEAVLRKRLPAGAGPFTLEVAEPGPRVEAEGLAPPEAVERDGRRYQQRTSARLAPGTELALRVELPPTQSDRETLQLAEKRAFLELDAAALTVREQHRLEVESDRALAAADEDVLYTVDLPDDASDVRFATDPPGIPLVPDGDGGIAVAGPLPSGTTIVEILYQLPVQAGRSQLALRSSAHTPLLSVFLADTGIVAESDRLHRRRPVRSQDRNYVHLEAFEVEPDEAVSLSIRALESPASPGRGLGAALVAVAALALAWFLAAPLRRRPQRDATGPAEADDSPARREREALYASIRDLEDDFETGKLSAEDHAALRDELRARAVALAQREREQARVAPAAAPAPVCARCGSGLRTGDRFCAQCGAPVAAPPEREASA